MRMSALTPRQKRRTLDLAVALAIVSVAFALAGLVWRMAGHAGTGAVTVPSDRRIHAAAATDLTPLLGWQPFGQAAVGEATQKTGIQAQLKGLVFALPVEQAVAFIATGTEPARAYHVGEMLAGLKIEGIQRDRILLNNGGRIEYLAFPDPDVLTGRNTTTATAAPSTGGSSPMAAPNAAPPPPSANTLIDRLGATPVPGGYAIGDNAPPGMQAGDVVQSINGIALTDPAAANAALANAGNGPAQITILRDGKSTTVTIPIR
ncbi:signaling protein [Sphingomonas sp. PL-96]|uniref:type II secretion system protein N n=1 Tax=Sphingomonas sp. PL-96 TaxID=2887201 RepID=UPI001E62C6B4|nr:type II secretion system protein N [Sphingomonas sp. PL-96]MCC2977849.1 signaling protein [Sphingomonas sp. PL-96]